MPDVVVPGDVLLLAAGDRVAADARLLEAQWLEVDEASLTGESVPVAKVVAESDHVVRHPLGVVKVQHSRSHRRHT